MNIDQKPRKDARPTTESKLEAAIQQHGGKCARCGFVPEHPIQVQFDHIDGDPSNIDPSNIQMLCVNCHTYKTFVNREYLPQLLRGEAPDDILESMRPFPPLVRKSEERMPLDALIRKIGGWGSI